VPVFGGMTLALITLFVVPVLYSAREERRARINEKRTQARESAV